MPPWERAAARGGHLLLYLLLLAQPAIGVVHSWSANFPIVVFGTVTLPNLSGPNEALKQTLAVAHWWLAWAILLVVAGHVAAALRHHFLLGDDVLRRMLPGARR
jgi:cytochrome b561